MSSVYQKSKRITERVITLEDLGDIAENSKIQDNIENLENRDEDDEINEIKPNVEIA
jgi:hypothetical protein